MWPDLSNVSTGDWIALYGAALSSVIAIVATWRYIVAKIKSHRERQKFQTDLYFLRKIDRASQKVHPIVVVLLANLGTERISLKSLEYEGVTESGLPTQGSMGWYEQPEELYGIRNRLLPKILESGETADLPMIEIGVITRINNLRIWLTDFNDRRYYLADKDIAEAKRKVEEYLAEIANAKG